MDNVDGWPDALQAALPPGGLLKRVFVLRETDSTHDAARRMSALVGDVIVAGRQTRGRGRLGRPWADTGYHGVAMTIVLLPGAPERLMLASAVATALAIEALVRQRRAADSTVDLPHIAIKWPNDVLANGRKLAGILIEQTDSRAYVGIGMNVTQSEWPEALRDIATSLAQCGAVVTRPQAAAELLQSFSNVLHLPDEQLVAAYSQRDTLRGQPTTFRCGGAIVSGIVREIDPLSGLLIETDTGPMRLPAQTTSVVKP